MAPIPWPVIPPPPSGTPLGAGRVHVTLALPGAQDLWDLARWDQATWDAFDPTNYRDVSCECAGVAIDAGRKDPLGHVDPGLCSFQLDNPDGIYSPWRMIDAAGNPLPYPYLGPGVPVRVATSDGPLFTGLVTSVVEVDDTDAPVVTVTAADPLALFADADHAAQVAQGAGELAGPRMTRIMAAAQVPNWVEASWSASGRVALQATTLAEPALSEMWLTADSDGGVLFATRAGVIRFVNGLELEQPAWAEPVAMIADQPDTPSAYNPTYRAYCPSSYTWTTSRDTVKNRVALAPTGGTQTIVEDTNSIARNGVRSVSRTDLAYTVPSTAHATWLTQAALDRVANADVILSPIEGIPTDDDDWWQLAHRLELHQRLEVVRARWGDEARVLATVDHLAHRITPDGWTMTIQCSPGRQLAGYTRWDTGVWDESYWTIKL